MQIKHDYHNMARKKLRIAQFVTSQRSLPMPEGVIWAPIDLAIDIADAMTDRGHEMTFYAPPSPKLKHKVISGKLGFGITDESFRKKIAPERRRNPFGLNHVCIFDQYLLGLMFKDAQKGMYDVLHVHSERALSMVRFFPKTPTLVTLHDPINPYGARAYRLFNGPHMHLISISKAQRKPAPDLSYFANIYNGIDTEMFPFREKPGGHFLFCGRLLKQKGVEDAVAVAKMNGSKLHIIGRHYSKSYLKSIKKLCTKKIVFRGNFKRNALAKEYGRAKALLFPIKWEEPFGLVMIEAMSAGTPVIAYDRGSVREVVKDGVTGFIVKNKRQMASAMKKIDKIDRRACRDHVLKNFTIKKMMDDYEKAYYRAAKLRR